MKCSSCGSDNAASARYCDNCGALLIAADSNKLSSARELRTPRLRLGLVLLIVAVVLLAIATLAYFNDKDGPESAGETNSGTLIVTLINPFSVGSNSRDFELYLNGQLQMNGTVPVGKSEVVETSLNWTGSELMVLIHVVVPGIGTQPGDRMVTLIPGETERVNIVLSAT